MNIPSKENVLLIFGGTSATHVLFQMCWLTMCGVDAPSSLFKICLPLETYRLIR